MKFIGLIIVMAFFLMNFQITAGSENDYGIVKAWFNGNNATVNGVELKIGQTAEIKVEVISKINGDVFIQLYEPGVTRGFEVVNGPSNIEERIDNLNIESGWSKTYTWTVVPSGAWKNGNAPINIFVQFYKGMKDKKIDFTIANPYILDEQYSSAASILNPAPPSTEAALPAPAKAAPSLSALFAIGAVLVAWKWREGKL